jgi:anti-sigma28 factor (negative regulator of flagellin synthesis)
MNVNEPNRSPASSSAATARARQSAQTEPPASVPDGHLAELVRSLCALAADSPERQAKIQSLMRAYASGNLQVDAEATASAMIDDAFSTRWVRR